MPVFLPDVEGQFAALALRPDGLAFGIGTSPDPRVCKHYQGVARVQGPSGTPYLLILRSGKQPDGFGAIACPFTDDDPGNLLVVELASRDKHVERLRSNRLVRDWPIDGGIVLGPTPPPAEDVVVNTIYFDGGAWENYAHPGGMQSIDDVLVLAIEAPYDAGLPANQYLFLDVSDPVNPCLLSAWEPPDPCGSFSAGLVGIAPIRTPAPTRATRVAAAVKRGRSLLPYCRRECAARRRRSRPPSTPARRRQRYQCGAGFDLREQYGTRQAGTSVGISDHGRLPGGRPWSGQDLPRRAAVTARDRCSPLR